MSKIGMADTLDFGADTRINTYQRIIRVFYVSERIERIEKITRHRTPMFSANCMSLEFTFEMQVDAPDVPQLSSARKIICSVLQMRCSFLDCVSRWSQPKTLRYVPLWHDTSCSPTYRRIIRIRVSIRVLIRITYLPSLPRPCPSPDSNPGSHSGWFSDPSGT